MTDRRQFVQLVAGGIGGSVLFAAPASGQEDGSTAESESTTQKDSDGDGIPDSQDLQPNVAATPQGNSSDGSESTATTTSSGSGPGFGPLAVVSAVVGAAGYLARNRSATE